MNLISGFWRNLDWDNWIYGLISALIGGGSGAAGSAVGVMVVDPRDFNLDHLSMVFKVMVVTFIVGAAQPFFAYLHQSSLPKAKVVTITETIKVTPPVTTKFTVEETKLIPAEKPDAGKVS